MKYKDIPFHAEYTPQDRVKILGTDNEGVVVRLGSAGDIEYIHVLLQGTFTPLTFREFQIEKIAVHTASCPSK